MYEHECFEYFEDLIDYLNDNNIPKEDIICVQKMKLFWVLIFYKESR